MSAMLKTELGKRALTAVLGVAVLLGLLFYGGYWGMGLITFVISMGMLLEFATLTFRLPDRALKRGFITFMGFAVHLWLIVLDGDRSVAIFLSFLCLFAFFLFTARPHSDQPSLLTHTRECVTSFFGFFYAVFLPGLFMDLRGFENGALWVCLFLMVIWAGDTGAYFTGKRFGKTKLYPLISPKKTWEGLIGGLLWSALIAIAFSYTALGQFGSVGLVLLALGVSAVSVIGDLCESLVKRGFDVKDSGSILPGHGGFLDRFDSVVFGLPIMYAGVKWIFLGRP